MQRLLGQDLAAAGGRDRPGADQGRAEPAALGAEGRIDRAAQSREQEARRLAHHDQFRYGFGNQLSAEESEALFEKWTIPSPGRPLFEAAFANFSRSSPRRSRPTTPTRGPLLVTAGGKDHTVPASISHATVKLYRESSAITDLKEFPKRGHSLTIDSGWEEVADAVLAWLKERGL